MGKISIIQGDITEQEVDAVVNAANTRLSGGGGVDGAIHRAAGPSLVSECMEIGGCKTGEAVITGGGNMPASKVIHTPGPVWHGGGNDEPSLLRNCYVNSFELAIEYGLKTIAFPAISAGVYGYPVEEAARIALEEGIKFREDFDAIIYVCYSVDHLETYRRTYRELTGQDADEG
jgi:O-acetyl-ADP-ribose deacetylase (regulator of RNase III)